MKSLNAVAKRGIISQVGYLGKQDPRDLEGFLEILIDKTVTLRYVRPHCCAKIGAESS